MGRHRGRNTGLETNNGARRTSVWSWAQHGKFMVSTARGERCEPSELLKFTGPMAVSPLSAAVRPAGALADWLRRRSGRGCSRKKAPDRRGWSYGGFLARAQALRLISREIRAGHRGRPRWHVFAAQGSSPHIATRASGTVAWTPCATSGSESLWHEKRATWSYGTESRMKRFHLALDRTNPCDDRARRLSVVLIKNCSSTARRLLLVSDGQPFRDAEFARLLERGQSRAGDVCDQAY